MTFKSKLLISGAFLSLFSSSVMAESDHCGQLDTIKIANMGWMSASTMAHIEAKILSQGFGCKTELVDGDTVAALDGMLKQGVPHVAPEMWSGTVKDTLSQGLADKKVEIIGDVVAEGGVEGWWIPEYLQQKYPDLKHVSDLSRYAELFAGTESGGKGRFVNCPDGWACHTVNNNLFKAYGLDAKYQSVAAENGGSLNRSIDEALQQEKPWLGYYWGPTAMLGKYDMVQLEMNPYNPDSCNTSADCAAPHAGSYKNAQINTLVVGDLQQKAPNVHQFLSKVTLEMYLYNELLAWGDENEASANDIAEHFILNYGHVWRNWVPSDVAANIAASF